MRRTFLRQALVVLAACATSLVCSSVYAQAASIQLIDSNCNDFALGGSPGARTLTCVVSSAPVCTVTGSSTAQNGSNLQLTASCSPAATSWVWTQNSGGTGCSSSTSSSCTDNQASPLTVTYKVTGSNANGAGPQSPAFPVVWSNTVTAPSGCVLTPGSSSQSAGYQATFSVSCSGGSAPDSWNWSGGGSSSCNTATCGPLTFQNTAAVNVTPSNSGGNGNQASSTITIGGGGGSGWNGSCPGYAGTHVTTAGWVGGTGWVFNTWIGDSFGANDIWVVKITPSATKTQATAVGSVISIENNGPPAPRWGSLSTVPCDLGGTGLLIKKENTQPAFGGTNAPPSLYIWVGANQPSHSILLQPGVEYYYNITNQAGPNGASSCSTGACDMRFTVFKPSGT
jgi:hypothetical protein